MPPHCDSLDGPVVTAARRALEHGDVDLVLPYVPVEGEQEVRQAFDLVRKARDLGPEAREVADRWLFETVVRVHRAGEGAPFTGLKPAGLDVGPLIPAAERALESGSPEPLCDALCGIMRDQIERRHAHAMQLKTHRCDGSACACGRSRARVDGGRGRRRHSLAISIIFDASALLTLLNQKAGLGCRARHVTHEAVTISAINDAGVLQKAVRLSGTGVDAEMEALGITGTPSVASTLTVPQDVTHHLPQGPGAPLHRCSRLGSTRLDGAFDLELSLRYGPSTVEAFRLLYSHHK